jgi:ubiquinone/menaquinone biosynthesis C-methylase UbiE
MNLPEKEKVCKFFDDYLDGFDALNNENKLARRIHRFLRASLFQRFELTGEEAKQFKPGFSAIDIGTGSGRYLALLAPYAGELTAIDLSEPMLSRARLRAEMEGCADKLTLLNGDFLDLKLKAIL